MTITAGMVGIGHGPRGMIVVDSRHAWAYNRATALNCLHSQSRLRELFWGNRPARGATPYCDSPKPTTFLPPHLAQTVTHAEGQPTGVSGSDTGLTGTAQGHRWSVRACGGAVRRRDSLTPCAEGRHTQALSRKGGSIRLNSSRDCGFLGDTAVPWAHHRLN